ncbi:bola-like protein-domain-containing protein [Schizophyllum amplum]|uniref:Bola-like protein-domain-containing protein n=1 Tax=Schizophyllum amplum TaxID=97359 RepID=A0A550CXE5_9AGAR|nr:bola-like protein-domain-containing protein [Auriculariopsis ampla]
MLVPFPRLSASLIFAHPRVMSTAVQSSTGPVETAIRHKLAELLKPQTLAITNDSWKHQHHAPMRAAGGGNGETHFSIQVVSDAFRGKSTIQRHRMIHGALAEELAQGLHSISLNTKTSEEAEKAATQ